MIQAPAAEFWDVFADNGSEVEDALRLSDFSEFFFFRNLLLARLSFFDSSLFFRCSFFSRVSLDCLTSLIVSKKIQ